MEIPLEQLSAGSLYVIGRMVRLLGRMYSCTVVRPDPKRDPADHLGFHEEVIQWQSERGHATVRKYKLDAPDRELRRLKLLKPMLKQLAGLQERLKLQNRGPDEQECRILWRLAHPSQPYSLMFRKLLEQAGIPPA